MEIELYDGTVLEFPDGTDNAVIDRVARKETMQRRIGERKAQNPAEYDPSSRSYQEKYGAGAPNALAQLGRGIGLAGRHVLEGVADSASLLTEPVRKFVTDPALKAVGLQGGAPIGQAASKLADVAGLPAPNTAGERIVGDVSRLLAGSGALGGAATGASKFATGVGKQVAQSLTANQASQAASAIGAGSAGGYVREQGGGPLAQFGASVLGGVAVPVALSGAQNVGRSARAALEKLISPRDIEGTLKVEFQRAGIDWDALSREAKAALTKDAENAIYKGQQLSPDALRRLADYRNIGATPSVGDITQDPRLITFQRNLSKQLANVSRPIGANDLPSLENQNAKRVIATLGEVADSPLDTYATGQKIIGAVSSADEAAAATERGLYTAARDSSGRAIPLNRQQFVKSAFENLAKSNKGAFLPREIRSILNDISRGQKSIGGEKFDVPFDVDTIESLKTIMATASRGSKDGNVKSAISQVRNALEAAELSVAKNVSGDIRPVPAGLASAISSADEAASRSAGGAQDAFTKARDFARSRRNWQESSAFIEDALGGATPDAFVKKHVIAAPAEELERLSRFIGRDKELKEAVRKQLVEHIASRGRLDADTTKFSSAGMKDALDQIGTRKLGLFFNAQERQQIRSAINVARYMQSQPIGSAVNNSNTAAMIWGKLTDVLLRGGEMIPMVGPMVAEPIRGLSLNMQARQVMNPRNALVAQQPRGPIPYNALLLLAGAQSGND